LARSPVANCRVRFAVVEVPVSHIGGKIAA
jgi:hypothetical protein